MTTNGDAILGGRTEFTTEVRFSMDSFTNTAYLTSYATTSDSDSVRIGIHTGGEVRLLINGTRVDSTAMDYRTWADGEQHTMSVTWDSDGGNWVIYVDGELVDHGSGLQDGASLLAGSGTIVYGNEQDSPDGGYDTEAVLSATLYDVRIWNEVRSEAEISLNYQHKFDSGNLPSGLIANWQMDGFNGSNEVVDVVSGNNLSIGHATGTGFTTPAPPSKTYTSAKIRNRWSKRRIRCTGSTRSGFPTGHCFDDGLSFLEGTDVPTGLWLNYMTGQTVSEIGQ